MLSLTSKKKKLYIIIVVVIFLFGIFLRTYKIDSLPPYRDEVSVVLKSFLWLKESTPYRLKIAQLLVNPFSYLLHMLDLSKQSIADYYLLTRLPGLFYGIIIMLILIFISKELIKSNVIKVLSFILICISTPILIHRSRLSVIVIQSTSLYYVAVAYFLFVIRRKLNLTSFIVLYTLLALVFHVYDVRVLFYIIAFSVTILLETIRLIGFKRALLLNSIGVLTFVLESFVLRPQYLYFLLCRKSSLSVPYVLSTTNINITVAFKNILLQLDPRFLAFDGGFSLASKVQAPFQHLLTIDAVYRVNGGFGILGYWGLSLYIIIPLATFIYLKVHNKLSNFDKFSIEFFLLLIIAYIISVSFYKYGVPHGARHLFFFAFAPIATCKIIDILYDRSKTSNRYMHVLAGILLAFILVSSLLTALMFSLNYYKMENNPAMLYAFETQYHKPLITAYNVIFNYVSNYTKKNSLNQVSLIYCFKNHERYVFVYAPTITNYAMYYAIKYFNTHSFNTYKSDQFELISKKVRLTFWVTGANWLEYVLINNTKYRPPWILQSDLIVIITERTLHNYTVDFLSKQGFIVKNIIKVNLTFLDSYYSMVKISDDVRMPSIIYVYVFKLNDYKGVVQ